MFVIFNEYSTEFVLFPGIIKSIIHKYSFYLLPHIALIGFTFVMSYMLRFQKDVAQVYTLF